MSLTFYLGTHEVSWLGRTAVPMCVSRTRFERQKSYPRALGPWMLDSGGFTELSRHNGWTVSPASYVRTVRRLSDEVGGMVFVSPQDWMCEPDQLRRTGLTVAEHQRRTVDNFAELVALAPDLPFVPVLQGWAPADYARCVELYDAAGIDLAAYPTVGVGTVCRRQHTAEITEVLEAIAGLGLGLRLHGYGVKGQGLRRYAHLLVSADSLAWSFRARMAARDRAEGEGPPHPCTHATCANCRIFAENWRSRLLASLPAGQLSPV